MGTNTRREFSQSHLRCRARSSTLSCKGKKANRHFDLTSRRMSRLHPMSALFATIMLCMSLRRSIPRKGIIITSRSSPPYFLYRPSSSGLSAVYCIRSSKGRRVRVEEPRGGDECSHRRGSNAEADDISSCFESQIRLRWYWVPQRSSLQTVIEEKADTLFLLKTCQLGLIRFRSIEMRW